MAEILVLDDVLDATVLIGKILTKKGHTVHPGMHAIMLTGYPTVKTAREAISLGADEYCVKPIDRQELEHQVDFLREVQEISKLVGSTLDLDTVLQTIVERPSRSMRAWGCTNPPGLYHPDQPTGPGGLGGALPGVLGVGRGG